MNARQMVKPATTQQQNTRAPSRAAISRFPKYLALVDRLEATGIEWTKSQHIATELGLVSATVRRDFLCLSCHGMPNCGYLVTELRSALIEHMALDRPQNLAIIGAGNLGKAIAMHLIGGNRAFNIAGIYDIGPDVIGTRIGGITVRAMAKLGQDMEQKSISFAVLTVHEEAAQTAADFLVSLGINGILNLSSGGLRVGDNVALVDMQIVSDLRLLSLLSAAKQCKMRRNENAVTAEGVH